MNEQNQQPDLHDDQAVLAAVQLLVRSMKPVQREQLLSTLMHEQDETILSNDANPEYAHDTDSEPDAYPIQPLVLSSDDQQRTSSEANTQTPPAGNTDVPRESFYAEGTSERRREERRPLETYAPFFLPFMNSLSRRQWWTRLVLGTIFLFTLSLSTLIAYTMGVHAGATDVASTTACWGRTYYAVPGNQLQSPASPFGLRAAIHDQLPDDTQVQFITVSGSGRYLMVVPAESLTWSSSSQCSIYPRIFLYHHHHDDGDR